MNKENNQDTFESISSEIDQLRQRFEDIYLPEERAKFLFVIDKILKSKREDEKGNVVLIDDNQPLENSRIRQAVLVTDEEQPTEDGVSFIQGAINKTGEFMEEKREKYDAGVAKIMKEIDRLKKVKVLKKGEEGNIWNIFDFINSERFDMSKIWNFNTILLRIKKIKKPEFSELRRLIEDFMKKNPDGKPQENSQKDGKEDGDNDEKTQK